MTHILRIEREGRLLHQHEVPDAPQPETRHLSDSAALRERQYNILQHIQETLDNPQTRDTFFRRLFGLFDGNNGQTFMDRLRAFFHGTNTTTTQPVSQLPPQQLPNVPVPPLQQLPNVPVPPLQQLPNVPVPPTQEMPEQQRKEFEEQVRAIPLPEGVTITLCTPEVVIISYKNNTENVWLTQPGNVDSIRTSLPQMAERLVSRVDGTPLPPQEETPPQNPPSNPDTPPQNPEMSQEEFEKQVRAATLLPYVTIARIEGRSVVLTCQGEEQTVTVAADDANVTQTITDGVRVIRYNVDRRIDATRDTLALPDGMTVEAAETPPYWNLRYRNQTEQVDVFAAPLTQLAEYAQGKAAEFKQRVDTTPQETPPANEAEQRQKEFEDQVRGAQLPDRVAVVRIVGRTIALGCGLNEQDLVVPEGDAAAVQAAVRAGAEAFRADLYKRMVDTRGTLALPAGMTVEASDTEPNWRLRYRDQMQEVDVFAVALPQLAEYAQRAAADFKQRVDTAQNPPPQNPPEGGEAEPRARIEALKKEIVALAGKADVAADGVDAHVAAIRAKVTAVNAAIVEARAAASGRFSPRWESQLVMAKPSLFIAYMGDDRTGEVKVQDLTLVRVPEGFDKTREARNKDAVSYLERQQSTSMGETIDRLLTEMGRQTSGNYTFEAVPEGGPSNFKYRIVVRSGSTSETWYVSRPNLSALRSPESVIIWKAKADGSCDRLTQASIDGNSIFSFEREQRTEADRKANRPGALKSVRMATAWTETFDNYRRIAEFNRRNEDRDAAGMAPREGRPGFDLPKNRPIATLQLFGLQHDSDNFQRAKGDYESLMHTMTQQGYHMVPPSGRMTQNVDREPTAMIEDAVRANLALGITDMYLNIASHGSDDGYFAFPKRAKEGGGPDFSDAWTLSYEQLMSIFRRYPQMHLTLNTIACYGAWRLRPSQDQENARTMPYRVLRDVPGAAEGRITVITHSIPQAPNITGGVYDQLLEYYIGQGKAYGEAHMLADRGTQVYSGLNPGVRRSSSSDLGYTETTRGPLSLTNEGEVVI